MLMKNCPPRMVQGQRLRQMLDGEAIFSKCIPAAGWIAEYEVMKRTGMGGVRNTECATCRWIANKGAVTESINLQGQPTSKRVPSVTTDNLTVQGVGAACSIGRTLPALTGRRWKRRSRSLRLRPGRWRMEMVEAHINGRAGLLAELGRGAEICR